MKKLIIFFLAVLSLTACLKGSEKWQGEAIASFQFSQSIEQIFGTSDFFCGPFYNSYYKFNAKGTAESFDGGFGLGYKVDTTHVTRPAGVPYSQYSVFETSGAGSTGTSANIFGIFYQNPDASKMPEKQIEFTEVDYGTLVMKYCYVCNSTKNVACFRGWEEGSEGFKEGDWMKLTFTGYRKGTKTADASVKLADFVEYPDSVVTTWTKVDLTPLGSVDEVKLSLSSNRENVPQYVCIDAFGGEVDLLYEY